MNLTTFEQTLDMEIMSVIVTLHERGAFQNVRVIPPQSPDESEFFEILFEALFGACKHTYHLTSEKRIIYIVGLILRFMVVILHRDSSVPDHVSRFVPERFRGGQVYCLRT